MHILTVHGILSHCVLYDKYSYTEAMECPGLPLLPPPPCGSPTPEYPHHPHMDYRYEDESDSLDKPSYSSSELSEDSPGLAPEDRDDFTHPQDTGPEPQAQTANFATFV